MTILDHGDGLQAPAEDDHKEGGGAGSSLTIVELANSIPQGMFIDDLFIDACLMGNIETATELKDKVGILIASEDLSWFYGFWIAFFSDAGPFNDVLSQLTKNPSQTSIDLGKDVVDSFYGWAQNHPSWFNGFSDIFTMAAYDLSHIPDLENAIDTFSRHLMSLDAQYSSQINEAITTCERMSGITQWADLLNFTQQVCIKVSDLDLLNAGIQVTLAHVSVIIDFKCGNERRHCNGMSILLPTDVYNLNYFTTWASPKYKETAFGKSNAWSDFLFGHYCPRPKVVTVGVSADEIVLGNWVTITIEVINEGGDADWQSIAVSFPDNPSTSNIEIVEHNLNKAEAFAPNDKEVGYRYGTGKRKLSYPLVEAECAPWKKGETHRLVVKVKPETTGMLTFYVKTVAEKAGQYTYDPSSGDTDQQQECVKTYTVTVKPATHAIAFYTNPFLGSITFSGLEYIQGQSGDYSHGSYAATANRHHLSIGSNSGCIAAQRTTECIFLILTLTRQQSKSRVTDGSKQSSLQN